MQIFGRKIEAITINLFSPVFILVMIVFAWTHLVSGWVVVLIALSTIRFDLRWEV